MKILDRFICFEASDCFGKTTTALALTDKLNSMGYNALYVRNPGHSEFGETIRSIVKTNKTITNVERTLLFYAVHYNLYSQVIKPHLDADEKNFVILDRYLLSTYFYNIEPKPTDYIVDSMVMDQWFRDNAIPDMTIVFDIPWEVYRERRLKRGEDSTDVLELDMKQSFEMNQKMLEYPLLYSADAIILDESTVGENVEFIVKQLFA